MLLVIMCSNDLQQIAVKDTGLWFTTLCVSPFLKIGTTLACFQSTGILPLSIESWKKNDWNGDSSSDELFKKWAGILSGPVALWGSILFSNFISPLVLIFISGMVGWGLWPLFGMVVVSSVVNALLNCSFKMLAWIFVSLYNSPSLPLRDDTPDVSGSF